MDANTHSAFAVADGMTMFIDGIPDECEHDWTGDCVFVAKSGKVVYWHTYRQWANLCSDARNKLIHEYHESIDDPILQGGVSCRKCKKPFSLPMF